MEKKVSLKGKNILLVKRGLLLKERICPYEKASTLKGKTLLPRGTNSSLVE